MSKSRVKKLFKSLIRPCQGAADENLAKFSSVGLKVNNKLRYSNPLTHPRKNPAGFSSATPQVKGGMALLAIFTVSFLFTAPTSALDCSSATINAPTCIDFALSSDKISLSVSPGKNYSIGSHRYQSTNNASSGVSVTLSGGPTLINKNSGDTIQPSVGTMDTPVVLADKTWGFAPTNQLFISGALGNFNREEDYYKAQDGSSDIGKLIFAGLNTDTKIFDGNGIPAVGKEAPSKFSKYVFYAVRADDATLASMIGGNYQTTVTYTVTANGVSSPTITNIAPDTYQLGSNASAEIEIDGENLDSVYQAWIDFGAKKGEVEDNEICAIDYSTSEWGYFSCTIPAGASIMPGTYDFYVTTQGGTTKLENGFTYKDSVCTYPSKQAKDGNIIVDYDGCMIPVKYTGNTSSPQWTSVADNEISSQATNHTWFNYDNKQWANAVTVKKESLSNYVNSDGSIITSKIVSNDDVLGYWVYIPRYAYEVMRRDATDKVVQDQDFDIRFETKDDFKKSPKPGCSTLSGSTLTAKDYRTECGIDRTYPTSEANANNTTWATHPAFTFGDEELNGIWVAKFETTGTRNAPTIKPNQQANISETIGNQYSISKSIGAEDANNTGGNSYSNIQNADDSTKILVQNSHNLASAKTHMLKNGEWGAVAYLSASTYGAGVNNTQINSNYNRSNTDADGASSVEGVTGCGPYSDGSAVSYSGTTLSKETIESPTACSTDNEHAYNQEIGQLASTTNNVYGIYDMSGGINEYVMGNRNTASGLSTTSNIGASAKEPYVDFYPTSSAGGNFGIQPAWSSNSSEWYYNNDVCTWSTCGGQALHETKTVQSVSSYDQSWDSDSSSFVNSRLPWFIRGGGAAGLFHSNYYNGTGDSSYGFRVALLAI